MQFQNATGRCIEEVVPAVSQAWWKKRLGASSRTWISQLYPPQLEIEWEASSYLFRFPKVVEGRFVYQADSAVLKWVARARTGALATTARFGKSLHLPAQACPCCQIESGEEDDTHALSVCEATGAADCTRVAGAQWLQVNSARGVTAKPLPADWLRDHAIQLASGLVPTSIRGFTTPSKLWPVDVIFRDFSRRMGEWLTTVMRAREALLQQRRRATGSVPASVIPLAAPTEEPQRHLSVLEVRGAQRQALLLPIVELACPLARTSLSSPSGHQRASARQGLSTWLRTHPQLRPVGGTGGEPSVLLMLLWETDMRQVYPCRSADIGRRLVEFFQGYFF